MQTIAERLKFSREKAGYRTAISARKAFGFSSTYIQHESGVRVPKPRTVERYAAAYRVAAAWLSLGVGEQKRGIVGAPKARFGGKIGAGQIVYPIEDVSEDIEATLGTDGGEAFEIDGDSMLPLARDGDIAFFDPPRPLRNLIGLECIVELEDGRRLFKTLERGSREGLFSLMSYNAEPIRDVEIVRAGPFAGIRRGRRR